MLRNLEANGLDYRTLPIVIQLNKRDLPDARSEAELDDLRKVIQPPVVPAVAIRGEGVLETLYVLLQRCYRSIDRTTGLAQNFGIEEREFLGQIFSHVDLRGAKLPPVAAEEGR
jgi:Fe2+ transport system protein B